MTAGDSQKKVSKVLGLQSLFTCKARISSSILLSINVWSLPNTVLIHKEVQLPSIPAALGASGTQFTPYCPVHLVDRVPIELWF